jgi:hypothetical protein
MSLDIPQTQGNEQIEGALTTIMAEQPALPIHEIPPHDVQILSYFDRVGERFSKYTTTEQTLVAIGSATMIATLALGGVGAIAEATDSDLVMECPAVAAVDIERAEKLLESPDRNAIASFMIRTQTQTAAGNESNQAKWISLTNVEPAKAGYRATIANEAGVRVHDYWEFGADLQQDLLNEGGPQKPVDHYLAQANKFLTKYDTKIRVGNDKDKYSLGFHVPTKEQLDTVAARQSIVSIMQTYSDLPEEYLKKQADTQELVLAYGDPQPNPAKPNTDEKVNYAAYNAARGESSAIFFNIRFVINKETAAHELAHQTIRRQCGGVFAASDDPGFTSMNNGEAYTNDPNTKDNHTFKSNRDRLNQNMAEIQAASKQGNVAKVRTLREEQNKIHNEPKDFTFVSAYGKSASQEEEADALALMTQVLDGEFNYLNILRIDCGAKQKFVYMFARMMRKSPKVANYFLYTNQRHEIPPALGE